MDLPPPVAHDLRINGCQILQPATNQLHNACSYTAIGVYLLYSLRRKFAELYPPYEPAAGLPLVDPYEWQKQLVSRGFSTTNLRLLLHEAQHFSGVSLRNGSQLKVLNFGCVPELEADGSLSIPAVCQLLSGHCLMLGVLKVFENYDRKPKEPYLVDKAAKRLGEHAVVVLGYKEVVEGERLNNKVPPGSYYVIQDSNAKSKANPKGINLAECSHLIEGYVAFPDFPYTGL